MASKPNDRLSKFNLRYPKRQQGDGHEIQVEVREDEEQSVKLQEIIDLLVAAGYFRARIKGLSSFDKVVGGMTWCIESCNVEVDVDLLFQENSTIGQKIALTEKIVAVLPKLQCPHPIEPHQIQGLDFIHIFPVIQWLVKKSMEFRSDTADFVYSYALNEFAKEFPQPQELSEKQRHLLKHIKDVCEIYKPHRLFRRTCAFPAKDLMSKVQITLLEYGCKNILQSSGTDSTEGLIKPHSEENEIQLIMDNMTVTKEEIFDFDELTKDDQEKVVEHYKNLNEELKVSGHHIEDQQLLNLKERRKELSTRTNQLQSQDSSIGEEIIKMKEMVDVIRQKQKDIDSALKELEYNEVAMEKVKEAEQLVLQSDELKKKEMEFRDNCKKELHRLQNSIEEAKNSKSKMTEATTEQMDRELEEQNEKLKVLKLKVAKKNRAISILQRRIDDVPSRAELAQYQKRFLELYNQISAKHKETKQYYSLYNTLEDTRLYMKKELSLLNSVSDIYPEAMLSKEGKDEFLQQFSNIMMGVTQSKSKLENQFLDEKKRRDDLSTSLHNLVELNRKYVAAIKQLKIECQKNETLLAKVRS